MDFFKEYWAYIIVYVFRFVLAKSVTQTITGFSSLFSPPDACLSDDGEEEDSSQQPQQVASALVNSSPNAPPFEVLSDTPPAQTFRPESFNVTLQRKDNEGFGFVILTSKNKPPPGG